MDLDAVIKELQKRRAVLDEAIAVFERLVEAEKQEKSTLAAAASHRRKPKPGSRKKAASV